MPLDKYGKKILYSPWPSKSKTKKYNVYVKDGSKIKQISFGQKGMGQYKDKGGTYKSLDHGDKKRRASYLSRAKGIRNKKGDLTYKDKNSANYWSINYLW
tara:strand:- start:205 stop:504 length:300 start_codon:yes stop_codon:yes gene_type:complete